MTSPTLDAVDKAQRLRRLKDAFHDVEWLRALYPQDQQLAISFQLAVAFVSLRDAVETAQKESDKDPVDPTPWEADLRGPDRDEWRHEAVEQQRLK